MNPVTPKPTTSDVELNDRSVTAGRSSSAAIPREGTGPGSLSYWLGAGLAVAAFLSGVATLCVKDWIAGPAVSVGTARGTALVVAAVAVPVLVVSMWLTRRGSLRGLVIWVGAAAYLLYNSLLLLFATPYNRLFLAYVAMLTLALWSIGSVLLQTDVTALHHRVTGRFPARSIVLYVWVISALNAMIWFKTIVPTISNTVPGSFLLGSGMTTNVVYVQDLAFWIPLTIVSATWLWRHRPWGYLLTSSILVMWVLEALGIASDQWLGSQADPTTSFATSTASPAFLAWAILGLVPAACALLPLRRRDVPLEI